MKKILFSYLTILLISTNLAARPISYSGGKTVMQQNDEFKNSLHLHYSPNYKYSLGYKYEYHRSQKLNLHSAQLNNLVKRWNRPAAQGNIYLKSALGNAHKDSHNQLFAFTGLAADFETRKYFIAYTNKYYASRGNMLNYYEQKARIGIAPYVANYKNIHTWLMLQISEPGNITNKQIITTPIIRLFKGANLIELGFSSNKKLLFNFIARF